MPVNHTIMQCTNQIANQNNNTRYNMSYDGCDVILRCLPCVWVCLFGTSVTQIMGKKKTGYRVIPR